jgi:hypothetical protein
MRFTEFGMAGNRCIPVSMLSQKSRIADVFGGAIVLSRTCPRMAEALR